MVGTRDFAWSLFFLPVFFFNKVLFQRENSPEICCKNLPHFLGMSDPGDS